MPVSNSCEKMQVQLIIPMAFVALLTGCHHEDPIIEIAPVDQALQPYFTVFRTEALARGVSIDRSFYEIEASIELIDDGNVIGECRYSSHYPNEIRIDREYWQEASAFGRELVVFHELGHCYLDRGHTEASSSSGTCLSIMASGTGSCQNRYGASTREAYLDELFLGRQ